MGTKTLEKTESWKVTYWYRFIADSNCQKTTEEIRLPWGYQGKVNQLTEIISVLDNKPLRNCLHFCNPGSSSEIAVDFPNKRLRERKIEILCSDQYPLTITDPDGNEYIHQNISLKG